jgi:signal transduction histidine kinase
MAGEPPQPFTQPEPGAETPGLAQLSPRASRARQAAFAAGAVLVLAGLYQARLCNYLLFHSLAELFSIVVATSMFLIVWNVRRLLDNGYLLFIGIACLFVGALDLLHTLAYKGMNVFPGFETNLPTQLWIAARYVQGLSLLAAPFFIGRRLNVPVLLAAYSAACVLILVAIFGLDMFPVCFVEGQGLTGFKKGSEYVICLILLGAVALLLRSRRAFAPSVLWFVIGSLLATIAGELAFTLYVDPYGFPNLMGHYLKIVAFYCMYKALIETGLVKPYSLLFRELKQHEDALQHSEETLRRSLAEIERSNAELEQFARVASHDLQAPLVTVGGYVGLLARRFKGQLGTEGDEFIAFAQEGVARMQQLIRDLLAYARVGTAGERFGHVATSELLKCALANLEAAITESGAAVACDELPIVWGDTQQLLQVFQNLVGNAIKFRGGRAPQIRVGAKQDGAQWLFSVQDNGIGIPPEARDRLFRMFERLHGVSEYPGSGIGLALCKKIVERHGGRIWVESEVGIGSTFLFTLPAVPPTPSQDASFRHERATGDGRA